MGFGGVAEPDPDAGNVDGAAVDVVALVEAGSLTARRSVAWPRDGPSGATPSRRTVTLEVTCALLDPSKGAQYALGDLDTALDYFGQTLPLARAVGDRPGEVSILVRMAVLNLDRGDLGAAVEQLENVVDVDTHIQHPDLPVHQAMLAKARADLSAAHCKP